LLRKLLLLLLAIGPLQAQAVFACAMMDTVVQDECCCEHHEVAEGCADHYCDSTSGSAQPCCERSVELGVDEDAADAATVKPTEVRSDADPPPALLSVPEAITDSIPSAAPGAYSRCPPSDESGSDLWLVTQRLRI
jgi:hypothetical protein